MLRWAIRCVFSWIRYQDVKPDKMCCFFFFNLIIFLQCCHKANSKATNQLFIGCLEDHSGVPAGQSATAESVELMTETNLNNSNIDLIMEDVSLNN